MQSRGRDRSRGIIGVAAGMIRDGSKIASAADRGAIARSDAGPSDALRGPV